MILISNRRSHWNMLFDILLTSLLIFSLNVRNSIMFFSFNVFFIALLLLSQNNDISLSILKKTLSKISTIVKFWNLSNDAFIIKQSFILRSNAISLKTGLSKKKTITTITTMLMLKTITMTSLKIRVMMTKAPKSVVAITIILIAKFMSFILLRLIFWSQNDKL